MDDADQATPLVSEWRASRHRGPVESSAVPVVLIHGFMGSASDWDPVTAELSERDVWTLALPEVVADADDCDLSAVEAAADSLGPFLAERLGGPFHLAGYSLGARVALAYAIRQDTHAPKTLALLSGNPGIAQTSDRESRLAADRTLSESVQKLGTEQFLKRWYEQGVFSSLRGRPEVLRNLIETKRHTKPEVIARNLVGYSPSRMTNYWPSLKQLSVPTLYVFGSLDSRYSEIAERFVRTNPRFHRTSLDACGHTMLAEAPAEVAEVLKSFWAKHGAGV